MKNVHNTRTISPGPQPQSMPFMVVTGGRICSPLTITQEEDGPIRPAPYFLRFRTGNCISLSHLLVSVTLSFLS